ncbi:MAG: hypothetical protein HYU54_09870 [Actinobacteria bacterium]|nr:hypothetical protein [Actinomycetota bacterium]
MMREAHRRRGIALVLPLLAVALGLAACAKQDSSGSGGSGLSITSPIDGASVASPLKLVLSAPGVEIGSPETGNMHFHVHIDDSKDYAVLTSAEGEIQVPGGEHTITVVLAEPNHSETDTAASVTVAVTGGATESPTKGGYGYGGGGGG